VPVALVLFGGPDDGAGGGLTGDDGVFSGTDDSPTGRGGVGTATRSNATPAPDGANEVAPPGGGLAGDDGVSTGRGGVGTATRSNATPAPDGANEPAAPGGGVTGGGAGAGAGSGPASDAGGGDGGTAPGRPAPSSKAAPTPEPDPCICEDLPKVPPLLPQDPLGTVVGIMEDTGSLGR
jgi:hypothetical protein